MDLPPIGSTPASHEWSADPDAGIAPPTPELPPGGLEGPCAGDPSADIQRQREVMVDLAARTADCAEAFAWGAVSAPLQSAVQTSLQLCDGARRAYWWVDSSAELMEQSLMRQATALVAGHNEALLPPVMRRPPPPAWSNLVQRLDAAEQGSGESKPAIWASELPVVQIPFALPNLYAACAEGGEVDCAGALGSMAGGALTLERLAGKPARTLLAGGVERGAGVGQVLRDVLRVESAPVGPSGRPQMGVVRLRGELDLPLSSAEELRVCPEPFMKQLDALQNAPLVDAEAVQGRLLGHGDNKRVHEYEPERAWVLKTAYDGPAAPSAGPLRPQQLLPIAQEVVAARRLAGLGLPANTAHGLLRLDAGQGLTGVGYVADLIPGAILFKHELVFPLIRNAKIGLPMNSGIQPHVLAALNGNTLDSLDLTLGRRRELGFRIEHEQPLLDPSTGLLIQQDAQGLVSMADPFGVQDFRLSLQVRNWIAMLLGRSRMQEPDLSQVRFRLP